MTLLVTVKLLLLLTGALLGAGVVALGVALGARSTAPLFVALPLLTAAAGAWLAGRHLTTRLKG